MIARRGAGLFHHARYVLCVLRGFKLARAGDDGERAIIADFQIGDGDCVHQDATCSLKIDAVSEIIR